MADDAVSSSYSGRGRSRARWRRSCRAARLALPDGMYRSGRKGACARRALTEGVEEKDGVCVEARARFADRPTEFLPTSAPCHTLLPLLPPAESAPNVSCPLLGGEEAEKAEHRKVTFGAPLCPSCRRRSCPFARRVSWRSRTAHASLPLFHIRLLRPGLLVVVVRAMAEQQFPDLFITQPLCDKCACD